MTWLQHRLESGQALFWAIVGFFGSAAALFHLVPKIVRQANAFYAGATFTLEIREYLTGLESRIVDRLNSLDDGQLNMIVARRQRDDNDPDTAYFDANPQGKTEWVSKTWSRWTGIDLDDARGSGWENSIAPEDFDRVLRNWQMAIDHQRNYSDSYDYIDRQGKPTRVDTVANPVRRKDGTILNYLGSSRRRTADPSL